MSNHRELLAAEILIRNADSHFVVDYSPSLPADPLTYIRLSNLYLSTLHYVCLNDSESIRASMDQLLQTVILGLQHGTITNLRQETAEVCRLTQTQTASHKGRKWRKEERYSTRLFQGNTFFVKNNFSIIGFRPNLSNSAVFLISEVITKLDDAHCTLLFESIVRLVDIWTSRRPSAWDANTIGFVATETTFLANPDVVPLDKVHPNARHWTLGQPILLA